MRVIETYDYYLFTVEYSIEVSKILISDQVNYLLLLAIRLMISNNRSSDKADYLLEGQTVESVSKDGTFQQSRLLTKSVNGSIAK